VNPIERTVRRVDGFQQRHVVPSFVFAVVKKYGDDSAGTLAALIAYYGFLSLFPLLLVLTTVLGIIFTHDASLHARVLHSTLGQFPIVGPQLTGKNGVQSLHAGSLIGLIVGLLGLVWGSLGVSQAAQRAMAEVWNIPKVDRPGFLPRLGRGVGFLALLGLDVVVTTFLAGVVTIGHGATWIQALAAILGVAANIALYVIGFRILTPKSVAIRSLIRGGVLAGLGWTVLQYAGTLLIGHSLRHASQTYGFYGSVLGLIGFLYLAAELTVYAAEVNVVHARHLYPRSLKPPPLTPADEAVLTSVAQQDERQRGQQVHVDFAGAEVEEGSLPSGG
jgi:uncharacterized BrkB/YihY/UPF0761 family membrane protein